MLLNIVKIRYNDTPVFIDVASVISQVGIESTINVSAGWSFPPTANSQSIGSSTSSVRNRPLPTRRSAARNLPRAC